MMEMDGQSVEPVEEQQSKRTGNSPSKIPSKKLKTLSGEDHEHYNAPVKYSMPETLLQPNNYSFSKPNVPKLAFPHETPRSSISFPKPERFFIAQKDGPPLSVSLNKEGDAVVFKLVNKAIKEYLSLGMVNFAFHEEFKWINRWSMLRYNQPFLPEKLYIRGAKSLDEILDCDSESDGELKTPRMTANIATDEMSRAAVSPLYTPTPSSLDNPAENLRKNEHVVTRVYFDNSLPSPLDVPQKNLQKNELVVPPINSCNWLSSAPGVPQENLRKNDVVTRVYFDNSLPSPLDVPQKNLQKNELVVPPINSCNSLSSAPGVPQENLRKNDVVTRVYFDNSLPSPLDVPQKNLQKNELVVPQENPQKNKFVVRPFNFYNSLPDNLRASSTTTNLSGQSELTQSPRATKMCMELGETGSNNLLSGNTALSGSEIIESHASPLKSRLINYLDSNYRRKVPGKSVCWSSELAAVKEIDRIGYRAVNRKKSKTGDEAVLGKGGQSRGISYRTFNQNQEARANHDHRLSKRELYNNERRFPIHRRWDDIDPPCLIDSDSSGEDSEDTDLSDLNQSDLDDDFYNGWYEN